MQSSDNKQPTYQVVFGSHLEPDPQVLKEFETREEAAQFLKAWLFDAGDLDYICNHFIREKL
jgi:hypothetical protein